MDLENDTFAFACTHIKAGKWLRVSKNGYAYILTDEENKEYTKYLKEEAGLTQHIKD